MLHFVSFLLTSSYGKLQIIRSPAEKVRRKNAFCSFIPIGKNCLTQNITIEKNKLWVHFDTLRSVHTATETCQKCEMFFTKSLHIFKCSVKRDNARFTIGKAKRSVEYCKIVSEIKFLAIASYHKIT